ncbi:hypothetical protein ADL27_52440, partial [Streptomyces sp. NRRL F-6602]
MPERDRVCGSDDRAGVEACGGVTAFAVRSVALLCALMTERSSVADLARTLREEVDRYSPGERLPSSRVLVERYRVSPVTVSRALAQLAVGLTHAARGNGRGG